MAREERDLYSIIGGEDGEPEDQESQVENDVEPRWQLWLHNFFGY